MGFVSKTRNSKMRSVAMKFGVMLICCIILSVVLGNVVLAGKSWAEVYAENRPEVEFLDFKQSGKTYKILETWNKTGEKFGIGTKKIPTGYGHQGGIVTENYYIFSVYKTDIDESMVYFARRDSGKIVAVKSSKDYGHMNSFYHAWGTNYVRVKGKGKADTDFCYDFSDIENVKKVSLSNCVNRAKNTGRDLFPVDQGEAEDDIYYYALAYDSGPESEAVAKRNTNSVKNGHNALLIRRKNKDLYKVVYFREPLGEFEDVSLDGDGNIYIFQHDNNSRNNTSGKSCWFMKINRADLDLDEKLVEGVVEPAVEWAEDDEYDDEAARKAEEEAARKKAEEEEAARKAAEEAARKKAEEEAAKRAAEEAARKAEEEAARKKAEEEEAARKAEEEAARKAEEEAARKKAEEEEAARKAEEEAKQRACGGSTVLFGLKPWYAGLTKLIGNKCEVEAPQVGGDGLAKFVWTIVLNILYDITVMVGYVAVIMVAWGGYLYMFSRGVPERAEKGKKTLIAAFAGLALAMLASAIMNTIVAILTGN